MSQSQEKESYQHAIRGSVLHFTDDPFLRAPAESMSYHADGLLIIEKGHVRFAGDFDKGRGLLDKPSSVQNFTNSLIVPGFIDTHVHYPQMEMIASFGRKLIDWLNDYTFIAEQAFEDEQYSKGVADAFCEELLRNGTTTASVFCSVHKQSVDALFEQSQRRNMRMLAGKVLMDRNAPKPLLDTPQSGYDKSKSLIDKWHGMGRNGYTITPRFPGTSSPEQLEAAASLWQSHDGVNLQSHLAENLDEIAWMKELFPACKDYTDIFDRFGLLGTRAIYAHGVHLSDREISVLGAKQVALSHCPTSNLFLGSGAFNLHRLKGCEGQLQVGVGTDVGAGTSFSILQTLGEAYKVSQMTDEPLSAARAFYLATLGGAAALCLEDKIGSFEVGKEADFIVLDLEATPLIKRRIARCETIEEILFSLMILGDDRCVARTYIMGDELYARDPHQAGAA